jgi:hypothetical protein
MSACGRVATTHIPAQSRHTDFLVRLAGINFGYLLYDCSEHVTWMRARLKEMRAGNPDAGFRPELKSFLAACLHAPTDGPFLLLQELKMTLPVQVLPKLYSPQIASDQAGCSANLLMSISQNSGFIGIRSLQSANWG